MPPRSPLPARWSSRRAGHVGVVVGSALLLVAASASAAVARAQGGVVRRDSAITTRVAQRGIVRGVVRDSLQGTPLSRAVVQLVATDTPQPFGLSVETDSLGQYAITGVPVGRYTVGFQHPRLDSLGLEPPLHGIEVGQVSDIRADLAIPSARRLTASVCGPRARVGGTMLLGFVRQAADQTPVAGARLEAAWLELRIDRGGIGNRLQRSAVTSAANGWFVFCDVPAPGNVTVRVIAGADTLDPVEFEMSGGPVERRELFIGASAWRDVLDSTTLRDSLVVRPRRVRTGSATLRGTIVRADNGRPLVNALVSIAQGPSARTDSSGGYVLTEAPAGTRLLEVRAVGYYPMRVTTTVRDGSEAPLIAMASNRSVLETVKVRANYSRFVDLKGFRERQRRGQGRFYTEADIDARAVKNTSDLLLSMTGVLLEYGENGERFFYQKTPGAIGADRCIPTVYLNGAELRGIDASTLDTFVNPDRIIGIEVYQAGMAPALFQSAFTGCGSLVFWTR